MDKAYADTVRLLLSVAPDVFARDVFAMKGGTAINLFVHDTPRLSVDIDVVYVPRATPRDEALREIGEELAGIGDELRGRGLDVRALPGGEPGDRKLLVSLGASQVKVEVNTVFRGTVLPVERRPLAGSVSERFGVELALPVLARAELYGGKLVAAMDRQHPRDLFDVWRMYETEGLTEATVECFVTYLGGHHRPVHEVLFANPKDIGREFRSSFEGMTLEPVRLETLLETRARLFRELPERLTAAQRRFLIGLARAEPDWTLLACPHASELSALQWKLQNLRKFKRSREGVFKAQVSALEARLL